MLFKGDKIAIKPVYSKEAIEEIDKFNSDPISVLDIKGEATRGINNEAVQGIYNLTKLDEKMSKPVSDKINREIKEFFSKKEFTLKEILDLVSKYGSSQLVNHKGFNKTTLGRVVFNEVVFNHFSDHKFINETCNKSRIYKEISYYSNKLIKKEITIDDYKYMINKLDQLSFGICTLTGASLSYNMLIKDDPEFDAKREEIKAKYQDRIDKGDIGAMGEFEEEVIKWSKIHYKDDPMMDVYESGAKGNWGTHFKNLKVSVGASPSPDGNMSIIQSSLKDGLTTAEVLDATNMQIFGAGGRALETMQGGYKVKMMQAAFQSTYGTSNDCGSTRYLTTIEDKASNLIGRHIIENGKEIVITADNVDKYIGKPLARRSPLYCKNKDGLCRHCLGELLFELTRDDKVNIGFFMSDIGSKLLGLSMKSTHDMNQKVSVIDDMNEFIV